MAEVTKRCTATVCALRGVTVKVDEDRKTCITCGADLEIVDLFAELFGGLGSNPFGGLFG